MKKFKVMLVPLALMSFIATGLSGCTKAQEIITWQEEVKLNDGRTIVVSQKKFCDGGLITNGKKTGCLDRESWLTMDLPEFSAQPIVWHEHLHPMIVNIEKGKLYVIGVPATEREYRLYGDPEPIYLGFAWENSQWRKLEFNEIPTSIYNTNMLIEGAPPQGTTMLTIEMKNSSSMNGAPEYHAAESLLIIDPKYKSGYPPMYKPAPNK